MTAMRILCLALSLALSSAAVLPARAQDQTLADIRQELSVLFVELQRLKRELSTTGSPQVAVGGDTLQRVDLIEAELARLTARTEELENRINKVVTDGTNRVGDLEFRLCELEQGCDIGALGQTPPLGGESVVTAALPPVEPSGGAQLAVGEQADFDRAKAALDSDDFQGAVDLFASFTETYSGGPLTSQAHYYRGQALAGLGETSRAARAYLQSFSGAPDGPLAAEALVGLGTALGKLGQTSEACVTLSEVGMRFPGSAQVALAEQERARLACP